MKITVQKSWQSRSDLDAYVRSAFGDDPTANAGISIAGTAAELQAMGLSPQATVYGVQVVETVDLGAVPQEVVMRGVPAKKRRVLKKAK